MATNAQVGPSGIVAPSGNVQFTHDFANNILLIGPSGIVTRDGRNLQLTADQASFYSASVPVAPTVPVAPAVPVAQYASMYAGNAVVGPSGIVRADGKNYQFSQDFANNIVLVGPSGIVTRDGKNKQFRKKRSTLIGSSGLILPNGQQVQFTEGGVSILLDGPSGLILSNGQLVQKRAKRAARYPEAIVGPSGIITPDGQIIQLEPGVSVVNHGPSGAVLSNGRSIQYRL